MNRASVVPGERYRLLAACLVATACNAPVREGEVMRGGVAAAELDSATGMPLLSVSGRQMVDPAGNWKRLRGVNYNLIQHTTRSPAQQRHIQAIASWGFNAIRLPISWYFLEPTPDNIDWSYVDDIEDIVRWADAAGLYVVIDNHQWNTAQCFDASWGMGFPSWFVDALLGSNGPCSHYATGKDAELVGQQQFWKEFWSNPVLGPTAGSHSGAAAWDVYTDALRIVAWRLRNYAAVAGWDILNEPRLGTGMTSDTLNGTVLPSFFNAVGARLGWSDTTDAGSHHLLFVEGEDGDIKPSLAKPSTLTGLVLAPHYYSDPSIWADCPALSSGVHRGLEKSAAWNVPALFGEFGAAAGPDGGAGPSFARNVSRIIGANSGQSWMWWEFGPNDLDGEMALASSSLSLKPAGAAIRDNLGVNGGTECTTAIVGETTVQSPTWKAAGIALAYNYTARATGAVNQLALYVDDGNVAAPIKLGLYSHNGQAFSGNPSPGTLLGSATIVHPVAGQWNYAELARPVSIANAAIYWIAVLGPAGGAPVKLRSAASGTRSQDDSRSGLVDLPGSWSPGAWTSNSPGSAYGNQ